MSLLEKMHERMYRSKLGKIKMGTNNSYNQNNFDDAYPELIEIGNNCVFATGSRILTHDAHPLVFGKPVKTARTILGNNVFLGMNAIVLMGVTIGNNVIVGAGAIVTKDVPDNVIVAGNPARIIRAIAEETKPKARRKL